MKCLILAVFLAIPQTPPVPRKATDSATGTPHTVARDGNDSRTPISPPPSVSNPVAVNPDQNASNTPKPQDAPQSVRVRELPPVSVTKDWADWGVWAFSGLLVIVGFLQFCVLWRQARIMGEHASHLDNLAVAAKDNAKAAKESILLSHRPKLIVRNVVSPQLETLHPLASVEDLVRSNAGDRFEGYFQVANIGNTPAVIQSIHDHIFIDRLPMERQYGSNRISEIRLAAGESRRIELTPVNVSPETQGVIVRERTNVYVTGLIAYTDGLGIRRETAFCRRLDRALQRLVPVQDNDYEYAD